MSRARRFGIRVAVGVALAAALAGCASDGAYSSAAYVGYGYGHVYDFYDPWYGGGSVIVNPPARPPARPERPIARPPVARPTPLPARPMPRPAPRGRLR